MPRRPLFVSGFMATGKSSVARRVAELSGVQCLDLDAEIERRTGASVAALFAERGELAFRRLERELLQEVLASDSVQVFALGGGALLPRDLRLTALERGVVVTLRASPAEILRRSAAGDRPLLAVGDPAARIAELLAARELAYAEAHAQFGTDGLTVDEVAHQVLDLWQAEPVAVAAGLRSYCVRVAPGACQALGELTAGATRVLVVTDSNVAALHLSSVWRALGEEGTAHVLPAGEVHKTTTTVNGVWAAALSAGLDRRSLIIALGGGVASDIAGFAAASYLRGISWVVLPTSLLAMVDASVGGKTGVDLGPAKNTVGAFWQPTGVLADTEFLKTEPERGFRGALAEVVKTALIGDAPLLDVLEAEAPRMAKRDPELLGEIVERCVRVKAAIVGRDERESGLRAVLNLGHTVGHALEAEGDYGRFTHGEAVSLGLLAALRIGSGMGVTPGSLVHRVRDLLSRLGLPVNVEVDALQRAAQRLTLDKKRAGGRVRFIVARAAGAVEALDVSLDELERRVSKLDLQ